jgi:4-alpha-glucanotransferase
MQSAVESGPPPIRFATHMPTLDQRLAGVLLHPTALPGPHGIGDFGPMATRFIDWLVSASQTVWQVLPLTPVGPGNSPYASVSAFAGSPLLVALEPLVERGWLAAIDEDELKGFSAERVDFERVAPWRMAKLRSAHAGFESRGSAAERNAFAAFCTQHASWLDDYALFMVLDEHHRARQIWHWQEWDAPLARRDADALAAVLAQHANAVHLWKFVQWCCFTQWHEVKAYANARGVRIVGDLPIFVAPHSADCWANAGLFQLDSHLRPRVVAGVPPDYFSATGQRWGNPLYDWSAMQNDGFAWWIARVRHELTRADIVRVDHFRGFAGYWEIPADRPTAVEGRWVGAPGHELFTALRAALGDLPVIAEDLGVITPDVEALRDAFGLPGMKVLQFAFTGDADHPFLPHNYVANCCVYTGTHDNDTVLGWWRSASQRERQFAQVYLDAHEHDVHWAMIRAAWASVAKLAVCPLQDALGQGSEHRMNTPASLDCWTWRFRWDQVGEAPGRRLAELSAAYGRGPLERLQLAAYPSDRPLP